MDKMTDEGDLLKAWLADKRYSAYDLAKMLGVTAQSVYHQFGLTKLSNSFVAKLKSAGIEISFDKLSSNGQELSDYKVYPRVNSNAKSIVLDDVILLNVPLVQEYAYAGYMSGYSDENYVNDLPTVPFIADKQYKGTYMAFQVRGDSMNDGTIDSYLHGDIVLCREISPSYWKNRLHINKWDFVIVHKEDGILIKKITFHDPDTGKITAHSLNPFYDDLELNLADVAQLFNVVKIERKK